MKAKATKKAFSDSFQCDDESHGLNVMRFLHCDDNNVEWVEDKMMIPPCFNQSNIFAPFKRDELPFWLFIFFNKAKVETVENENIPSVIALIVIQF